MIPRDYITAWRATVPWVDDSQVEQDLIISRALVEIFSEKELASSLAFRGGTALHKLYFRPAARYSEDVDLVQMRAEAIGPVLTALHKKLDPWLGAPQRDQSEGRVTLNYRFFSEDAPPLRLRLKVEINSREHFTVFGYKTVSFAVDSRWFRGSSRIVTYELEELLATKLRALYQRRKGRDLFDLALALEKTKVDPKRIVQAFGEYMQHEGHKVSRAQFERSLAAKLRNAQFIADIGPLLAASYKYDRNQAAELVSNGLVALLPGEPWKKPRAEK